MGISKDEYGKMTDKASGSSPKLKNGIKAFLFGGAICCFGQAINELLQSAGLSGDEVKIENTFIETEYAWKVRIF